MVGRFRLIVVCLAVSCSLLAFLIQQGSSQIYFDTYGRFTVPSYDANIGRYYVLVMEPAYRWGNLVIRGIEFNNFRDIEIVDVRFDRGNWLFGRDSFDCLNELSKYNMKEMKYQKLRHRTRAASDKVFTIIKITGESPSGPHECVVKYSWFGIPFSFHYSHPE